VRGLKGIFYRVLVAREARFVPYKVLVSASPAYRTLLQRLDKLETDITLTGKNPVLGDGDEANLTTAACKIRQ
jgi:hypothetical protein